MKKLNEQQLRELMLEIAKENPQRVELAPQHVDVLMLMIGQSGSVKKTYNAIHLLSAAAFDAVADVFLYSDAMDMIMYHLVDRKIAFSGEFI